MACIGVAYIIPGTCTWCADVISGRMQARVVAVCEMQHVLFSNFAHNSPPCRIRGVRRACPAFNCVTCASRGVRAAHRVAVEYRDGVGHVRVRQGQVRLLYTINCKR